MNQLVRLADSDGLLDPIDTLLADVAIRIQLAPSDQRKAEQALRHHQMTTLSGLVVSCVAMWSSSTPRAPWRWAPPSHPVSARMSSISTSWPSWRLPHETAPAIALNILYHSIRGERGSRYYDMTTRNTRCVTVNYADAMHLDITPAVLLAARQPKTSVFVPPQSG